jgi:Protein of unknown function (DUF3300)/YceI-like domain
MKGLQRILALYFSSWLLFAPGVIYATQTDQSAEQSAPPVVKQTPEELQQLVAPIALYPDALISQILAGATYPTEIVEADPWGNPRIAISATTKINRKDFGLTWNAALETGGILVGDEVTITLDVEFIKA